MEIIEVWRLATADGRWTAFYYDEFNAKARQTQQPQFTVLVKEQYTREVWEAFCDMMDNPPKELH